MDIMELVTVQKSVIPEVEVVVDLVPMDMEFVALVRFKLKIVFSSSKLEIVFTS